MRARLAGIGPWLVAVIAATVGSTAWAGQSTGSLGVSVQVVETCQVKSLKDLPKTLRLTCGQRSTTVSGTAARRAEIPEARIPVRAVVETAEDVSFLTLIY